MDKLEELKRYIDYEFSSGCYTVEFIKGGTENKYVYISISDVRYFSNDWYNHILIRTAKNEVDYKGGFNHYTTLDRLEGDVCKLLNELPF